MEIWRERETRNPQSGRAIFLSFPGVFLQPQKIKDQGAASSSPYRGEERKPPPSLVPREEAKEAERKPFEKSHKPPGQIHLQHFHFFRGSRGSREEAARFFWTNGFLRIPWSILFSIRTPTGKRTPAIIPTGFLTCRFFDDRLGIFGLSIEYQNPLAVGLEFSPESLFKFR